MFMSFRELWASFLPGRKAAPRQRSSHQFICIWKRQNSIRAWNAWHNTDTCWHMNNNHFKKIRKKFRSQGIDDDFFNHLHLHSHHSLILVIAFPECQLRHICIQHLLLAYADIFLNASQKDIQPLNMKFRNATYIRPLFWMQNVHLFPWRGITAWQFQHVI